MVKLALLRTEHHRDLGFKSILDVRTELLKVLFALGVRVLIRLHVLTLLYVYIFAYILRELLREFGKDGPLELAGH